MNRRDLSFTVINIKFKFFGGLYLSLAQKRNNRLGNSPKY